MPRSNRFTIFDRLEQLGYFQVNSANPDSRDLTTGESLYKGPVEFPKMLFHPQGEEKITSPGEEVHTPLRGAQLVGQQRELIYEIAQTKPDEARLRAEGWHIHPAQAIKARVERHIAEHPGLSEIEKSKLLAAIPQINSESRIQALEAEIARLQAQQETLQDEED